MAGVWDWTKQQPGESQCVTLLCTVELHRRPGSGRAVSAGLVIQEHLLRLLVGMQGGVVRRISFTGRVALTAGASLPGDTGRLLTFADPLCSSVK